MANARKSHSSGCLVVMYHYVHDRDNLGLPSPLGPNRGVRGLTCEQFEQQLDLLQNDADPIDWPTLHAWLTGRRKLPDRCFLLSFDDGLVDHARFVLPVLEERDLRGLFFVPGAVLTSHRLLPAHAVHLLLERLGDEQLARETRRHLIESGLQSAWHNAFDATRAVFDRGGDPRYAYETPNIAKLKYLLTMTLPIDVRNDTLEALFERHVGSSSRWARHWYLSWDHLQKLQNAGHTIGAHGYTHEPYGRLSPIEQRYDAVHVRDILNEGLGSDLRPFSFPFGSYDESALQAVRDAGFAHAFTTEHRWLLRGDDPFALPRVDTIHVDRALRTKAPCPVA